jgi:hypothetical protein
MAPAWTEEKLADLAWCFFEASKPHSSEFKDLVVEGMKALGHTNASWDATR